MRTHLLVALCGVFAVADSATAQAPQPLRSAEAVRIGRTHCVRLASANGASAVVLHLERVGKQVQLDVVTAFHAVADAKTLALAVEKVDAALQPRTLADSNRDACEVAVAPDVDLAFIRFRLDEDPQQLQLLQGPILHFRQQGADVQLTAVSVNPEQIAKLPVERSEIDFPYGYALGYPQYDQRAVAPIRLQLGRGQFARTLYTHYAEPGEIPKAFQFRLASLGETAPGMSGGLVIDSQRRFVGLVHGRINDTINLIIPAETVASKYALHKGKAWLPFAKAAKLLNGKTSPYQGAIGQQGRPAGYYSDLSWTNLTQFSRYFNDPGGLRVQFQEVVLTRKHLDGVAADALVLRIHNESFAPPAAGGRVRVWINALPGQTNATSKDFDQEGTIALDRLVPGENLIILRRELPDAANAGPLNLAGLLHESVLDFSVRTKNAAPVVYRVRRTLPAIVTGFDIYLTLELPPKIAAHDAYVAARLSWLEGVARDLSTHLTLTPRDPHTGTFFRGTLHVARDVVRLNPNDDKGAKLVAATPVFESPPRLAQHLDVRIPLVLKADEIFLNAYGVQFHEDDADKLAPLPLEARLRAQWVIRDGDDIMLSVRLISATPKRAIPWPLKLGQLTVALDLAPAVQEVLVGYLNRAYLNTDKPALPGFPLHELLRSTFRVADTPLSGFRPKQVLIKDGWLVVTLRSKTDKLPATFRGEDLKLPDDPKVVLDMRGVGAQVTRAQFLPLMRDEQVQKYLAGILPEQLPPIAVAMRLHQTKEAVPAPDRQTPMDQRLAAQWRAEVAASNPRGAVRVGADFFFTLARAVIGKPTDASALGDLVIGHEEEVARLGKASAHIGAKRAQLDQFVVHDAKLDIEPVIIAASEKHVSFNVRLSASKIECDDVKGTYLRIVDLPAKVTLAVGGGERPVIDLLPFGKTTRVELVTGGGATPLDLLPKLHGKRIKLGRDGPEFEPKK